MKLICREGDVNLTKDNFVYAESELHYVSIWVLENDALQKYSLLFFAYHIGWFRKTDFTVSDIWRIHKSFLVNAIYVKTIRRYGSKSDHRNILSVSQAKV